MTGNCIGVINTPVSNSLSVFRALNWLDLNASLVTKPEDLKKFSHIIVPGVSRFDSLINEINTMGFANELQNAKTSGKAILGLCAGMQIMGRSSDESPGCNGLEWFDFDVKSIESSHINGVRNFHTGWNDVREYQKIPDFPVAGCYYFNHSYYVEYFSQEKVIGVSTNHINFASVIRTENIIGAQFHPEKSQKDGLNFLQAFWQLSI